MGCFNRNSFKFKPNDKHVYKGKLSMLVGISEAICMLIIKSIIIYIFINFNPLAYFYMDLGYNLQLSPIYTKIDMLNPNKLKEWLAGLIDADGCFLVSKKGYVSLEITKDIRDKKALFLIKQNYGGSVKLRSGVKAMRYRKHHKIGKLKLIEDQNGKIRNPIRILQFSKICEIYEIPKIFPVPLTYYNGWFAGFFDGDGSIYKSPDSIIISASNNAKILLDEIFLLYGGVLNITNTSGRSFKWQINRKDAIQDFIINYFHVCPSHSAKFNRIKLVTNYFELKIIKAHLAEPNSINGKMWRRFLNKWDTWS